MPKRVSSKIANQISPLRSQNSGRSQLDANTIEEMARIFMQTQANIINSKTSQPNNSQEVLVLLQQINSKLEGMQGSLSTGESANSSQQDGQQYAQNQTQTQYQPDSQETTGELNDSNVSQELKKLFSTLLTPEKQTTSLSNEAQGANGQPQRQSQKQNTMQANKQNSSIAVQTAAQVLSQAQYELSNELEASLQSLKQVISESEKIANKISNLLGEENDQKQ